MSKYTRTDIEATSSAIFEIWNKINTTYYLSTLMDHWFIMRSFGPINCELVTRRLFLGTIQTSNSNAESFSEDKTGTNKGIPQQNITNFFEASSCDILGMLWRTNPFIFEDPKNPIAM